MPSPDQVRMQIERLTGDLIGFGLCDKQSFPSLKNFSDDIVEVACGSSEGISLSLKDISYVELYNEIERLSLFGIKMLDGAFISLHYRFECGVIVAHRLVFFPSPYLEEFQNNPEIYIEDDVYAEVVSKGIVPFPLRFDYDARPDVFKEIYHPMSHLTLGQYKNCRIPASSALTPFKFLDFILRNFYHTSFYNCVDKLSKFEENFDVSIFKSEERLVYVSV